MILSSPLLAEAGFRHAFPTRAATEADLLARVGGGPIVQVRQVHGGVAVVAGSASFAGAVPEADAVVARVGSGSAAEAVGVRVADCVPVLLADPRTGNVAAVHAGWRGVVANVVRSAVELLGAGPLLAAIGPCIGPCCFEVGADVAEQIAAACGDERVVIHPDPTRAHVDLRACVRAQLLALGVAGAHVDDVPGCTRHSTDFHSYRRDGARSGRMLAAIATRPSASERLS